MGRHCRATLYEQLLVAWWEGKQWCRREGGWRRERVSNAANMTHWHRTKGLMERNERRRARGAHGCGRHRSAVRMDRQTATARSSPIAGELACGPALIFVGSTVSSASSATTAACTCRWGVRTLGPGSPCWAQQTTPSRPASAGSVHTRTTNQFCVSELVARGIFLQAELRLSLLVEKHRPRRVRTGISRVKDP